MNLPVLTVQDVADFQLCCGCGACAYVAPDTIEMVDVPHEGRRPSFREGTSPNGQFENAIRVCPGIMLEHKPGSEATGAIRELMPGWGPILEVWEGHATDPQFRYAGSSGGVASAFALYAVEKGDMYGVLHTAGQPDKPYLNQTVLSRSRSEVFAATGSRYAPASPCDGLKMIEEAPAQCLFIGKPCDVAGARKAAALRPELHEKLGITVGIFCAGTPSTRGTLEMLKQMGVGDPASLTTLRYRGNGWPGNATAVFRSSTGTQESRELSYAQSWGDILTKHVQWRCRLCPDHTGEFADIAVGDPWHKPPVNDEPGRSLIVVRTPNGREFLRAAIEAGYVSAQRVEAGSLPAAQPNLLRARASVWGRLIACRLAGLPIPKFRQMPLAVHWWHELTVRAKLQSVLGTFKRIHKRGLWRKRKRVRTLHRSGQPFTEIK